MDSKMVKDATQIYLISYMEALESTKNPNIAVQCAMAVTTVLVKYNQSQQNSDPFTMAVAALMEQASKNPMGKAKGRENKEEAQNESDNGDGNA